MRAPSAKKLREYLCFRPEDQYKVGLMRRLLTLEVDPTEEHWAETFPNTQKWVRACHHRPSDEDIALHAADEFLGNHGVEGWADPTNFRHGVSYSNTGDTYATTICLINDDCGKRWYLGSWGDLAERNVCHANEA